MRRWDDSLDEMVGTVWIDRGTSDRILSGLLAPDDAPPGFTDVLRLLRSLASPPSPHELATEDRAVAMAQAILRARSTAPPMARSGARARRRFRRTKVTALVLVGTMFATSGLAAAGVLPAPLQSAASDVLDVVGIHVPDPTEVEHPASTGEEISELATTTDAEGVEKGALISDTASGGISRAGEEHGPPADPASADDGGKGKGPEVAATASEGRINAGSGGPPAP
jgi:hypothetical protein